MRFPGPAVFRPLLLLLGALLVVPAAHAQNPSPDVRGIYVYTKDVAAITNATASQITASLAIPGVDGVALVIGWNAIEPAMGQYQFALLDQWLAQAISLGKKIDLVVPAGVSTPAWLFQAAPSGAGVTPLNFTITPHDGSTGNCQNTTMAAPWDPVFLSQWDAMLSTLSAHLKASGTYNAVTLVRLTGINRTTEELRLPAQTAQSTNLACVSNSLATWQAAGYRPSLLLQAWNKILGSFAKSFPDKTFAASIIPVNAFPGIAEGGSLISGTIGDDSEPLLMAAVQQLPGRFIIQYDFLMTGEAANSVVTTDGQNYGTAIAFQTNEYLSGNGAACSEPVANPTPCTATTFLQLLNEGIYPLGSSSPMRSKYIEVFHDNAAAFPADVLQAHLELTCDYALSYGGQSFPASGGTGTITIMTGAGCPWTLGNPPAGVTFSGATSGTGSGTVTFQVAVNAGGDVASAFTIVDQTFTIEQQAGRIGGLNYIGSMPHLAAEGGWLTTFTFVNKGTSAAMTRTDLFAPAGVALPLPIALPQQSAIDGNVLASSLDQVIAPNAQFVMQATGPTNVAYLEGSAQLAATGAVDGFAIFHYNPNNQEAVVPMETRNAPSYLLPFDNTNGVLTGVAIENVSAQPANVQVVIRNDAGAQIGTGTIALNAAGHTSFVLSDPVTGFPVTANIRGTVEFDTPGFGSASAGQISVLGIRYTGGTVTTIPVLANVNNQGGLMAHLASGAGWQTTFVLVNAGSASAQAQLTFFADNGSPLPLPLTFPQGGSPTTASLYAPIIAPGASLWIQSGGPAASALLTGSAQLKASGNISGFVIFRYNPNGQEAVVPLENRNANSYVLAFDNTGGTVTGVALNMISAQGASVPVVIRNDTGVQIGASSISLNANGHTSFTLTDPVHGFPATANIRGTVEFDTPAAAQISVLGIRSPPALTFTTLPALSK